MTAPLLVLGAVLLAAAPAVTAAGTPTPPPQGTLVDAGEFHALTPARVLDTRLELGGHPGAMRPGETFSLQLAGRGGVPAEGASSVVLNVTATGAGGDGFVVVYPTGSPRPAASTLNLAAGGTVANAATARLGAGGRVDLYVEGAASHLVVDVVGWYDRFRTFNQSRGQAGYVPLAQPVRVLDSRTALGGHARTFQPGESFVLPLAAAGAVPADATAVQLSVTGADATATTFVTVWNTGAARPTASTLNLVRGQTAANSATVPFGVDRSVSLYNDMGSTHLVVDVMGYFRVPSDASAAGQFAPLATPARLLDTRSGTGGRSGAVPGGHTVAVAVAGVAGVPRTSTRSVALTVTATQPSAPSFVTVWPGGPRPTTSNLNVAAGETRAVLVLAALGPDGAVRLYNNAGTAHLVVDVVGWYTGVTPPAAAGNPALPAATAVSAVGGGRLAVGHGQQRSPEELQEYWTPDRLAEVDSSDMTQRSASARVAPTPAGSVASGAAHPQYPVFSQGYLPAADHRDAIGRLYATTPDGSGGLSCSGTVVARNVVLTAAHCVYSLGQGFNNDLVFVPGQRGAAFPFGTWQPQAWYVYPQFYTANSGAGFAPLDYALLVFGPDENGTEIGSLTGYLPVLTEFAAGTVTSYGYPAEGWFQAECAEVSCQVWSCTSPVSGYSTGAGWFEMGIGCNTAGGASGGPMIAHRGGTWYVVSVNSNSSNDVETAAGSRYYTGNMWGPVFNGWTSALLAQHARY